ncbi:Hsp33 family molecular chaperone HslO [Solimonas sp. K1W22B-7]|uniref:Hsp33 family molecular chaperone HslO n=1 Tax=Solimonas sp. K1W22B-7 TaxID=2303331 RepID=UPI000E32ED30|nr:Hsp33 family molecular chaperone HslO [Solimonas sp. K1W22B-7]AXQ30274.1 Hsp33 family molecular chaperone HslO [Solimonas sp. K1W22B-7]
MNELRELLFPERGVRGAYVDLREGIQDMTGWRHYAPDVHRLLGQALAATPLLASHLKFEGRINLQFKGKHELQLLVTQIDHNLELRGMAKAGGDTAGSFQELMDEGMLAMVMEPARGTQYYQAVVEIMGDSLAVALEGYFTQSEQLATIIRLAAGPDRLVGLMLQRLPAEEVKDGDAHWEHMLALAGTLGEQEMLEKDGETLLRHLFHEEDRRVFEPRNVALRCRCSHASISAMLLSLGQEELQPVLDQHGRVAVTCEFCGREYSYTEVDIRALVAAENATGDNQTRQ